MEKRLPDDLPALITSHLAEIRPEVASEIHSQVLARRTGWFDTHPADRDRIARAKREGRGSAVVVISHREEIGS